MNLPQYGVYAQPEQFAKTDNLTLCYQCFGHNSNPPLLLIMGLATQMIHWDDTFCTHLAEQGFWVIRFDNRDIGKSEILSHLAAPGVGSFMANKLFNRRVNVPYYLSDMAQDTLDLMDYLDIAKAHIVGASMGGMIAQSMAIAHPERMLSLTSIMSTTGNRKLSKPTPWVIWNIIRPVPKEQQAYIKHVLNMWKMLHGDRYEFDEQKVTQTLLKAQHRGFYPAGVKRQTTAIIASPDRTSALRQVSLPTLVLHGGIDPLVPLDGGQATADAIGQAKLKVYENMGHTIPQALWADIIEDICTIAS